MCGGVGGPLALSRCVRQDGAAHAACKSARVRARLAQAAPKLAWEARARAHVRPQKKKGALSRLAKDGGKKQCLAACWCCVCVGNGRRRIVPRGKGGVHRRRARTTSVQGGVQGSCMPPGPHFDVPLLSCCVLKTTLRVWWATWVVYSVALQRFEEKRGR